MFNVTIRPLAAGAVALAIGFSAARPRPRNSSTCSPAARRRLLSARRGAGGDLRQNIEGVRTQVQATKASVENLNLLQQGKGEIAFALGDSVVGGPEGNAEAGFAQQLDKLRAIAAIYPNYIQIVACKESGIETLADLKGKRLSVGAPKSGTELNARAIFGAPA